MATTIRRQILFPFATTLVIAVTIIAVTSAWMAARRSGRENLRRLQDVVDTLGQVQFPYTSRVLTQMQGLSGAEFVALDKQGNTVASTLPEAVKSQDLPHRDAVVGGVDSLGSFPSVQIAGTPYLTARLRAAPVSAGVKSLVVLFPERRWKEIRWEAAWPPLAIGAITVAIMIAVSAWLSNRLGRRIQTVQELFGRIADGSFDHARAEPPRDELHELVLSANRLSDQLDGMQRTIRNTERIRLLAQLAGGLAHQWRNAITGARMAIQLHQKRCGGNGNDESLQVALRQLSLTEEHVKGLLALGQPEKSMPQQGDVQSLIADLERLVSPACSHHHVHWQCDVPEDACSVIVEDCERTRAALLNITLNALDAAGSGGTVRVHASVVSDTVVIEVSDSGPGPATSVQDTMFDPFVTSKPEGIGLGLPSARQHVEALGGTVTWRRQDDHTVFAVTLPVMISQNATTGQSRPDACGELRSRRAEDIDDIEFQAAVSMESNGKQ